MYRNTVCADATMIYAWDSGEQKGVKQLIVLQINAVKMQESEVLFH